MKKYIFPVLIIFLIFIFFSIIRKSQPINENSNQITIVKPSITPTPLILPHGTITEMEFENEKYLILWVKIPRSADISLKPNFVQKFSGEKLIMDYNCDLGINGGFYLADDKPLGLFYTDRQELGKYVRSNIANAFVLSQVSGETHFTKSLPDDWQTSNFIFQTGPLIIPSNIPLKLINDEKTRRSLLGKDTKNNLYLISVILKDDFSGGPNLADIPVIFYELKNKNILPLEEIVNLDGGSASFFHSEDEKNHLTLPSWTAIGSLLCVRLVN